MSIYDTISLSLSVSFFLSLSLSLIASEKKANEVKWKMHQCHLVSSFKDGTCKFVFFSE